MRVFRLFALLAAVLLTSCSPASKSEAPRVYQMGDRVATGHLVYTVFGKQWQNQFGSGPDARVPQNRFYLVRISVLNNGPGDAMIPPTEIVDDAGASSTELTDGDGVTEWLGALRQLHPLQTAQGYVLFDVAAKHYRLQVTGEDGKPVALVDLPLTFDADSPEVTTPLDPGASPIKK